MTTLKHPILIVASALPVLLLATFITVGTHSVTAPAVQNTAPEQPAATADMPEVVVRASRSSADTIG